MNEYGCVKAHLWSMQSCIQPPNNISKKREQQVYPVTHALVSMWSIGFKPISCFVIQISSRINSGYPADMPGTRERLVSSHLLHPWRSGLAQNALA